MGAASRLRQVACWSHRAVSQGEGQTGSMNDFVSHAARATAHLRDNDRLAGLSLVIEQRILDGSKLTTCYHLVLGDRAARVHDGPADRPDVTIEQD